VAAIEEVVRSGMRATGAEKGDCRCEPPPPRIPTPPPPSLPFPIRVPLPYPSTRTFVCSPSWLRGLLRVRAGACTHALLRTRAFAEILAVSKMRSVPLSLVS
jgi:hypothetical protein